MQCPERRDGLKNMQEIHGEEFAFGDINNKSLTNISSVVAVSSEAIFYTMYQAWDISHGTEFPIEIYQIQEVY